MDNPHEHGPLPSRHAEAFDLAAAEDPRARRRLRLARRLPVVAAIVAALALWLLLLGDSVDIDSDLHLCVPPEVLPGAEVPLRAAIYAGLTAIEGPRLAVSEVDVELHDASARIISRARLRAAVGGMRDMEGTLRVSPEVRGRTTVVARTKLGEQPLRVDAQMRVLERAAGQATTPRSMRGSQHRSEGPLHVEPGQLGLSALHVEVAGGACIPEQPCTLLAHVGRPAVQVTLQPSAAVSLRTAPAPAGEQADTVVRFDVMVHGPEAELQLMASRAGTAVTKRTLRLPVALGAAALALEPRVTDSRTMPKLTVYGEPGGCVIDLFSVDTTAQARWLRTASAPSCERGLALPFGPLAHGTYRVQVRRDVLSSSTAAVGLFYVTREGQTHAEVLAQLAAQVRGEGHVDALLSAVAGAPGVYAQASFDGVARYLLALLESDLVVYPAMVTGYAQSLYRADEKLGRARGFALLALLAAGFGLAMFVGQRGLRATERAGEIMQQAGQDPVLGRRAQTRALLAVIASVIALLLVFVVVGLYVLARGGFR